MYLSTCYIPLCFVLTGHRNYIDLNIISLYYKMKHLNNKLTFEYFTKRIANDSKPEQHVSNRTSTFHSNK